MSTQENNRAIAVFMGGEYPIESDPGWVFFDPITFAGMSGSFGCFISDLHFDTSWDWLMPVWKKAASTLWEIRGDLNDDKYIEAHRITKSFMYGCQRVEIETAYGAVLNAIEFITWYNTQNKHNEQPTT